jgi:hypothetical protein
VPLEIQNQYHSLHFFSHHFFPLKLSQLQADVALGVGFVVTTFYFLKHIFVEVVICVGMN